MRKPQNYIDRIVTLTILMKYYIRSGEYNVDIFPNDTISQSLKKVIHAPFWPLFYH